jgi:hypothetical protein
MKVGGEGTDQGPLEGAYVLFVCASCGLAVAFFLLWAWFVGFFCIAWGYMI